METGEGADVYDRSDIPEDPVLFVLARGAAHRSHLFTECRASKKSADFNEALPCSQERDLHLRLAAAGLVFTHLPETLYRVRKRPTSVSHNYTRVLDQHASILWPIYNQLKAAGNLGDRRARRFRSKACHGCRPVTICSSDIPSRRQTIFDRRNRCIHPVALTDAYSGPARLLPQSSGSRKNRATRQHKTQHAIMTKPHIFHLIYREGLVAVTSSQVLRPLSMLMKQGYEVSLVLLTPIGEFLRITGMRQWKLSKYAASQVYGGRIVRIPSPPSRWRALWNEGIGFRLWARYALKDKPSVVHCRGALAVALVKPIIRQWKKSAHGL